MYKRVMEKLCQSKFDAFIVQKTPNINFLCNKGNYFLPGILLITRQKVYLATLSRNIDFFEEIYKEYEVFSGGLNEIAQVCNENQIKNLGYESSVSVAIAQNLKETFIDINLQAEEDFIEDIRMVKTPEEIEKLKMATRISDQAYIEFLNYLKIGQTEKEARAILDHLFLKFGADDNSFPTLLSSGDRTFLPHSAPSDKIIQKGDLVLMDFGVMLNGYCSDTTRTVVMGKADEKQLGMYQLVLKAQMNALDNIEAGETCKKADAYARDIINNEIENGCFDYGLGHGIGLEIHEKPRFHPDSDYILKPNTAMSVEPGIYMKGWGGIRIEDVMIVENHKGGRNLTSAPKEYLLEI